MSKNITIRLPDELYDDLKYISNTFGVTVSKYVRSCITTNTKIFKNAKYIKDANGNTIKIQNKDI